MSAVVLQLTARPVDGNGSVQVWPHGVDRPGVRALSFQAGSATTTVVVAAVGKRGRIALRGKRADAHLTGTILGYYS